MGEELTVCLVLKDKWLPKGEVQERRQFMKEEGKDSSGRKGCSGTVCGRRVSARELKMKSSTLMWKDMADLEEKEVPSSDQDFVNPRKRRCGRGMWMMRPELLFCNEDQRPLTAGNAFSVSYFPLFCGAKYVCEKTDSEAYSLEYENPSVQTHESRLMKQEF
ncbi:hypothetical protein ACH5RR_027042 [Cinchona calisaya]|uniref:Uncharacterized protein n=1 Tax=Cinchona calisaya TaxID=153742 RepID=A0ABD2Z4C6_9GENT